MAIFKGSGVALITPFNEDLSVDYEGLRKLVDFHVEHKTDAIIVCGTSGESATMSVEEHLECIDVVAEQANGRIPVIAGTGSNDTMTAIELSKEAESLGADGLLVVTPYYNKSTQRGLVAHFTAIADAVNIPIILYNIPGRTGVNIAIDTYKQLGKHKNIVAVKEASGNLSYIAKLIAECGDLLDVYSGNDDQIVPIMSLGGKGVISVLSNVMPKEAHQIAQYCLDNNCAEAAKLQIKLLKFINNLFIEVNPIPVKEAMNMAGWKCGIGRMPLYPMADENRQILKDSMAELGLLK